MPLFSRTSLQRLFTCDTRLQKLMHEVIKERDIIILCGHRGKEEQEKAVADGNSKVHYPHSKHNSDPSRAVDFAPYHQNEPHIRWDDLKEFSEFAEFIKLKAKELGIDVICGKDFPEIYDTKFRDYPHIELKGD